MQITLIFHNGKWPTNLVYVPRPLITVKNSYLEIYLEVALRGSSKILGTSSSKIEGFFSGFFFVFEFVFLDDLSSPKAKPKLSSINMSLLVSSRHPCD